MSVPDGLKPTKIGLLILTNYQHKKISIIILIGRSGLIHNKYVPSPNPLDIFPQYQNIKYLRGAKLKYAIWLYREKPEQLVSEWKD